MLDTRTPAVGALAGPGGLADGVSGWSLACRSGAIGWLLAVGRCAVIVVDGALPQAPRPAGPRRFSHRQRSATRSKTRS